MKQAIKKKEGMRKSISAFKEKRGLNVTAEASNIEVSNADKEMDWLLMPKAFQDVLKLPGIPLGYFSTICGHSNTGKSTLVNHAIAAAQRKGLIPVIIDTENNFNFEYAINMGVRATPVYGDVEVEHVDPETGEITWTVENKIINYDGDFIYYNNDLLAKTYGNMDYSTGKQTAKYRKVAVIEDVAACINDLLNAQDEGEIEQGFLFIWDSVGSIDCYRSYKSLVNNPQWNAATISSAFGNIINDRIPRSRKMSSLYTNTLLVVNKVWLDSSMSTVPSLTLKGGSTVLYGTRLLILLGGKLKASTKKLTATSKGASYNYGLETKVQVIKNQLPQPWTVTYEGSLCCTPHGFVGVGEMDSYRKEHIGDIIKQLSTQHVGKEVEIKESDIIFEEGEADDTSM